MEASFYSLTYEEDNFPSMEEIIKVFSFIYSARGEPQGDELENQIDVMIIEACMNLNIQYTAFPGSVYFFHNSEITNEQVEQAYLSLKGDSNG